MIKYCVFRKVPRVLEGEKEEMGERGGKSGSDCRDTACKVALPGLCGSLDTQVPAEMINRSQLGEREAQETGAGILKLQPCRN